MNVSMPRLTHEVKVALPSHGMRQEPDHLMQLNAPVNDRVHRNYGAHVGVHVFIHQPEGQGLVPYQSLSESTE